MAAVQTSYADVMPIGVPGMVANMESANLISRTCVGAAIPFGAAVLRNGDHGCSLSAGASDLLLGIAVQNKTLTGATPDQYVAPDTVAILTMGTVFVACAAVTIVAGEDAYWDETAKLWTNVSTTNSRLIGGKFDRAMVSGAGICAIAIRANIT